MNIEEINNIDIFKEAINSSYIMMPLISIPQLHPPTILQSSPFIIYPYELLNNKFNNNIHAEERYKLKDIFFCEKFVFFTFNKQFIYDYDFDQCKLFKLVLPDDSKEVCSLSLSPNNLILCIGHIDGNISIYDFVKWECIKQTNTLQKRISKLIHISDKELIVSTEDDLNVLVFNQNAFTLTHDTIIIYKHTIHSICAETNQRLLAFHADNKTVVTDLSSVLFKWESEEMNVQSAYQLYWFTIQLERDLKEYVYLMRVYNKKCELLKQEGYTIEKVLVCNDIIIDVTYNENFLYFLYNTNYIHQYLPKEGVFIQSIVIPNTFNNYNTIRITPRLLFSEENRFIFYNGEFFYLKTNTVESNIEYLWNSKSYIELCQALLNYSFSQEIELDEIDKWLMKLLELSQDIIENSVIYKIGCEMSAYLSEPNIISKMLYEESEKYNDTETYFRVVIPYVMTYSHMRFSEDFYILITSAIIKTSHCIKYLESYIIRVINSIQDIMQLWNILNHDEVQYKLLAMIVSLKIFKDYSFANKYFIDLYKSGIPFEKLKIFFRFIMKYTLMQKGLLNFDDIEIKNSGENIIKTLGESPSLTIKLLLEEEYTYKLIINYYDEKKEKIYNLKQIIIVELLLVNEMPLERICNYLVKYKTCLPYSILTQFIIRCLNTITEEDFFILLNVISIKLYNEKLVLSIINDQKKYSYSLIIYMKMRSFNNIFICLSQIEKFSRKIDFFEYLSRQEITVDELKIIEDKFEFLFKIDIHKTCMFALNTYTDLFTFINILKSKNIVYYLYEDIITNYKDEEYRKLFSKKKYSIPANINKLYLIELCKFNKGKINQILLNSLDIDPIELISICEEYKIREGLIYLYSRIGDNKKGVNMIKESIADIFKLKMSEVIKIDENRK